MRDTDARDRRNWDGVALCVYCGSSNRAPDSHKRSAERFGRLMAARGQRLIYGGGRVGIMGVIADAALAGGGKVTGVIPEFLHDYEVGHTGVTELVIVDNMHLRKQRMAELADGFVILPGGLGTLDETFEILTWKQLGLHDKPIVLVNTAGYWDPVIALIDAMVADGYVRAEQANLISVVDSVDDVFDALAASPAARISVRDKWL